MPRRANGGRVDGGLRMNAHRPRIAALLAFVIAMPAAVHGQVPASKPARCDTLYRPFHDRLKNGMAYNVCAVDAPPRPTAATFLAEFPHWSGDFMESITLVVDSDGQVDSTALQRTGGADWSLLAERTPASVAGPTMASVRSIRYRPAIRRGERVRAAIHVVLLASSAPDSLPAVATWRYLVGAGVDTMQLEWAAGTPLALGDAEATAAVLLVAAAELRVSPMDFRDRARGWNGCSWIAETLPYAAAVRERLRRSGLALSGDSRCPVSDDPYGVRWTALFRASDTKYVARFTYPAGMDGRMTGRCWVERIERGWQAGCG
jgi:hypothetical protein